MQSFSLKNLSASLRFCVFICILTDIFILLYPMKQRRYIAWMLMVVSIVMLTASVLPHHHHHELLCLQHDVEACGCACDDNRHAHHEESAADRQACSAGCVTKFDLRSQEDVEDHFSPADSFCSLLYQVADLLILPLPVTDAKSRLYRPYLERLHSACLPQARGLRAPPVA